VSDEFVTPAQPVESSLAAGRTQSELTLKRVVLHSGLLILTLTSCFLTGALLAVPEQTPDQLARNSTSPEGSLGLLALVSSAFSDPRLASSGAAYALTLISILLAHEMGHYFACRYYGIRATLPFFIPAPTFVGTFGAFIRIKEPITSRRALFDIGIAGPLAGFAVAIPASFVGLLTAHAALPAPASGNSIVFQDPLLFKAIMRSFDLPRMMEWNPVYFAAWVGMLATSLNLLPVGQLDGGHVVYALLGRRGHRIVAITMFVVICILALWTYMIHRWPGWFVYVVMLAFMLKLRHPPVMDEHQPMDRRRQIIGLLGLLVFFLSFMPFPIAIE
jgi:membrane-associated protease RseP (regulator of RpoE activity)